MFPSSEFVPSRQHSTRRWVAWTLLALLPLVIVGLFYFHVIVSAGAAGGCGGG
jgi:hypothetical protein